ncbi:MAG: type III pantothenate kinase [Reichenbachiella sp.]|uniref:type III pantothenate kinase n=1 Tax=Reichenbachiella sp. TaxID=2184521 RepID=UPI0032679097
MPDNSSNIVIDIGNSSLKVGQFVDSELVADWNCHSTNDVVELVSKLQVKAGIVCSVGMDTQEIVYKLKPLEINILTPSTPIPFNNHYNTKNTLGLDRIAALAGVEKINSGKNNLVIDIGSCITYDFLDKDKNYHGGSISPGVNLRFRAMHDYTQRLPLITNYQEAKLIGNTTREAMMSGVMIGITAELDGIISHYQIKWPDLEVIMCGGGLNSFESKLKAHIFASPKLVLIGLNRILEYNEKT